MVILNGYAWKNEKKATVSLEYMRSLSGALDLRTCLSGCFDIVVDNQIGMNSVVWNLNSWELKEMSDMHNGQGKDTVPKKGGILKEILSLLAPSVCGWINMSFVCSLPVAQQVLLTQEAAAKFVPKCLLQEDGYCFEMLSELYLCAICKILGLCHLVEVNVNYNVSMSHASKCLVILPRLGFTMNLDMGGDCNLISEVQRLIGSSLIRS